ncbi:Cytochrome P450 monooxygenase mpaDE'-like protein [Cladobotryum mycophilum]|uniref:Cytochrome P450 monooxygenase mpaDE'-like protein n=1 Tax=Cladobotryum mycophilum TaxID=491253 RepID=A0ABR0SHS3_9HYPO
MTVLTMLPSPKDGNVCVQVKPFETGLMTTPASVLVGGAKASCSATSWRFFVHHKEQNVKLWFDMGISSPPTLGKQDLDSYPKSVQGLHEHFRPQPAKRSLSEDTILTGTDPNNVNYVILSHGHWDHARPLPKGFESAIMVCGPGATLHHSPGYPQNPESPYDGRIWDSSLRTFTLYELPSTSDALHWTRIGPFPHALDFFGDESFFLISAPGHLPGNLAALARVCDSQGRKKWVFLGGDCAHCNLFTYWPSMPFGRIPSALMEHGTLHHDPAEARLTIQKISQCKMQLGEDFLVWYAHSELLEGQWEFEDEKTIRHERSDSVSTNVSDD